MNRAARSLPGCLFAVLLLLLQGGPLVPGPRAAEEAGLRMAVRSGDPAPGSARLHGSLVCGPAAIGAGTAFVDGGGTAVFVRDSLGLRAVAYAGGEAGVGARFASFSCPIGGPDGGLTVPVILADGRDAIYGIDPGGGPPRHLVAAGATVRLNSGDATVGFLWGHAADDAGGIILPVYSLEGNTALLRVTAGGAITVLAQSGDPLGPGRIAWISGARPAVNRSGTVVFAATLEFGESVLAALRPGETPVVLFLAPAGSPVVLAPQGPAIDDAGNVAFTWFDRGTARLQQIVAGFSQTIVAPGTPVQGGGTVLVLAPVEPVVDEAGEIVFGALLADGREGILAAAPGQVRPIVLTGQEVADAGALESIPIALRPAVAQGGRVLFAGRAGEVDGILEAAAGDASFLARIGDRIDGPARFASFLETRTQYLGAGPAVAPGGLMIFDARVTGGGRGLFARNRDGDLTVVAMGGDPAPGGGTYDDDVFSFHSINAAGTYAFLGTAGVEESRAVALFYGRLGAGPPRKLADIGPYVPRGTGGAPGASYFAVPPPSRVNRRNQVVFSYRSGDGSEALYCYDGVGLTYAARPGDQVSLDDRLATIFTGSYFLGVTIPPYLGDDGGVLFGGQTEGGDAALFRGFCAPAPSFRQRILGVADMVPGGRLQPFELQALHADTSGRIAFEAVYNDDFDFGVFTHESTHFGGETVAVARRFDLIPDIGFVLSVTPRLALLGDGRLAFGALPFSATEAILITDPAAGGEPRLLADRSVESPDGGFFRDFQASGGPVAASRTTARLSSDGAGTLAFAASTTAGPQGVFLHVGGANEPPVADAGPPQTVECAGPDGTEVLLDGRGSSDPEGAPLSFVWTGPFGVVGGPQPSVRLPLGSHRFRLVVSDGVLESDPAEMVVDVLDTRPPALALGASPAILWPPDGRMVEVALGVGVSDLCDPTARALLLSVTSSEPASSGRPGASIQGAALGTDDRVVALRAERSGAAAGGRTYTIIYGAIDASDNAAMATATVVVPHDRSGR